MVTLSQKSMIFPVIQEPCIFWGKLISYIPQIKLQQGARVAQWVRSLDLTTHTSLSPIRRGFAPGFVNYKKGCTRLAAASDNVYQLLAHGRWVSPGTPASSTTKTGRHDIAEILLKVALKHQKSIKSQHVWIMIKFRYLAYMYF